MDLVDIALLELVVAALPADKIPEDYDTECAQGSKGRPVYYWVAKKKEFDSCNKVLLVLTP